MIICQEPGVRILHNVHVGFRFVQLLRKVVEFAVLPNCVWYCETQPADSGVSENVRSVDQTVQVPAL